MSNKNRTEITAAVWGSIAFALFGLFLSGLGNAGLTVIHLVIALALLIVPLVTTAFIWDWGRAFAVNQGESTAEKVKRDRLEEVLRNLSNAELQALKERFRNNEIDDEMLYNYLSEEEIANAQN